LEEKLNDRRLIITPTDRQLARQAAEHFLNRPITQNADYSFKGWADKTERMQQLTLAYASEIGVAKKLKMQWNGMSTGKRQADVGDIIEVRWTSTNFAYVYEYDRDQDLLFVVKGASLDNLYIAGFIPIKMAKVDAYRREVDWAVPIAKLYTYLPENQAVKAFILRFSQMV